MQKLRPDMDIGKTIRTLRLKSGLTQEAVVLQMEQLGCHLSRITYSKMERNQYSIKISELAALKLIFDVDFADFFTDVWQEIQARF